MTAESLSDYTHDQWRDIASRELASPGTRLIIDGDYRDSGSDCLNDLG